MYTVWPSQGGLLVRLVVRIKLEAEAADGNQDSLYTYVKNQYVSSFSRDTNGARNAAHPSCLSLVQPYY